MKTHFLILIIVLLGISILTGCTKEQTETKSMEQLYQENGIPIKVEHFHEYSLQRFLQQAIQRGTGKDANKKMVYVKFLLYSPLIFYTITKKIIKYRKKKLHKPFNAKVNLR